MILWLEHRRPVWRRPGWCLAALGAMVAALVWMGLQPWQPPTHAAAAGQQPQAHPAAAATEPATPQHRVVIDDSLARTPDLKQEFDRLMANGDAAAQASAARAWQACVPVFLPPDGGSASPDAMIAGLPAKSRAPREDAWRALWARCQGFFAAPRAELLAQAGTMRARAAPAGAAVLQALARGERDEALARADSVLASGDAAAVASLSGLARRWREARDGQLSRDTAAAVDATDAGLAVLDCDLGADCSSASLAALQLCAAEGLCEGDVVDRRFARFGAPLDYAAVDRERERLAAALHSGARDAASLLRLR
jgi:ubiquinone biosynthesis protein UbiJ